MKLFVFPPLRVFLAVAGWLGLGLSLAQAQTVLPSAQVGQNYSFQITTTPSAPSGTIYSATGLPSGLLVNASSGIISGAPTTAGTASGTISLNSNGVTNNFTYTLAVNAVTGTPAINSLTTASATVGTAFSYTVSASNTPTSYNIGTLPPGLSASGNAITGQPTTAGTYQVALSANNNSGTGGTTTLTITVNAAVGVPVVT